jgi:Ca2+-binding EF-hand superfamily protein
MMKKTLMTILGLSLGGLLAQAADGEAKPKPAPALPELLKKYDKNGDGKLDQEERAALQKDRQAEMMKKYDKNGDGKIDEEERKAMLEDRRKQRDEALAKRQAEQKKLEEKKPEEKK